MMPPAPSLLEFTVLGLPMHPLVVHAVVVLLPLGALATALMVVVPKLRERYALLSLATLTVGALSAIAARITGEDLAQSQGLPARHALFGTTLAITAVVVMVVAWVWWFLERRHAKAAPGTSNVPGLVAGGLTVAGALAIGVLTVLVGHSGAEAVWGARSTATSPASGTYTLAQVAQHNSATSCWAAIDGGVYDLTQWVNSHPGGPQRILNLCGTDASDAFEAQHDSQQRPNTQLATFRIGNLV